MAVKKHKLVPDNQKLQLVALATYFQQINKQPQYLPPSQQCLKHCQNIIKCLSRTVGTDEQLRQLLQPIEEFLLRFVSSTESNFRHQILIKILDKYYTYISDPKGIFRPATAAMLVIIEGADEKAVLTSARWIVNQRQDDPSGSGHISVLSRLYHWIYEWRGTPALGTWTLAYIKALEENQRLDVLIEAGIANIAKLFLAVANPSPLCRSDADVIFHVLASLRESSEAFDIISPHVVSVLETLASESGHWSRQLLQNLVDILTSMVDRGLVEATSTETLSFGQKYEDIVLCLARHISSGTSSFVPAWHIENASSTSAKVDVPNEHTTVKVGLTNLGNTCYMNSVLQALFAARSFSSFVMVHLTSDHYWSEIAELFAKMQHSTSPTVSPLEVSKCLRPPYFKRGSQHDSSEFLSHLFQMLRSTDTFSYSYGHMESPNYNADCFCFFYYENGLIKNSEDGEAQQHHVIPGRVPNTSGSKKRANPYTSTSDDNGPSKKRLRTTLPKAFSCKSFVEYMFGGSLMTQVQCTECHCTSISKDAFWDLQLSFPENLLDKKHSVQSLLEYYCSVERLAGDNRYHCRECQMLRDADRSVFIEVSPRYLVLVLKNFDFDPKTKLHAKKMQTVSCSTNIVLPTVQSKRHAAYSIFAAVIHSGRDIDSGHYYTIAKSDNTWYTFDDARVTIFNESLLNNLGCGSTPYMLFYKRSDMEDMKAPSLNELPRKIRDAVKSHNRRNKKYY